MDSVLARLAYDKLVKQPANDPCKGLLAGLFRQQLDLINHPSKRKAACCSRRAGKSVTAAAYLLLTMHRNPGSICVYLALTRKSAKRILWPVLKNLAKKHKFPLEFKDGELIVEHANGSQLVLMGANDEGTAENLRGSPYHLVVLDEVASFRGHIDQMIEEIIEPALVDYDGDLLLIGTPSSDFTSLFYYATTGKNKPEADDSDDADDLKYEWAAFKWTMFDNPYLKGAADYVRRLKKKKKWADDNPKLLREYYGLWAKSSDELVYRYNPLKNMYVVCPKVEEYVLGIDLGFNDSTAFIVWGYNRAYPDLYLMYSHKQSGLTPSQIGAHIDGLRGEYDFTAIVCDEGGLGKSIAEEFRTRFGVPVKAAEKTQKRAFIELMNGDLIDGKIKIPEHGADGKDHPLAIEWGELLWDRSRKLENPTCENHLADAALYSWREARHYLFETEAPPIETNSPEHWQQREQEFKDAIEQSRRNEQSAEWWAQ